MSYLLVYAIDDLPYLRIHTEDATAVHYQKKILVKQDSESALPDRENNQTHLDYHRDDLEHTTRELSMFAFDCKNPIMLIHPRELEK